MVNGEVGCPTLKGRKGKGKSRERGGERRKESRTGQGKGGQVELLTVVAL